MEGYYQVFSLQSIKNLNNSLGKQSSDFDQEEFYKEEEKKLLINDDFYFSKDQYDSSIKRGVIEFDSKQFQIYTKELLHHKKQTTDLFQNQKDNIDIAHTLDWFLRQDSASKKEEEAIQNKFQNFLKTYIDGMSEQEIMAKFRGVPTLYSVAKTQFPGIYCPKMEEARLKQVEGKKCTIQAKKSLFLEYVMELCAARHLVKSNVFKLFFEHKIDPKKSLQAIPQPSILQIAQVFEVHFYDFCESQTIQADIKKINQFSTKVQETQTQIKTLQESIRNIRKRCEQSSIVNKIDPTISTVNYQSFLYQIKLIAETLETENEQIMQLSSKQLQDQSEIQKRACDIILDAFSAQLNEIDALQDTINTMSEYLLKRKELKNKYSKLLDDKNQIFLQSQEEKPEEQFDSLEAAEKLQNELSNLQIELKLIDSITSVMVSNMMQCTMQQSRQNLLKKFKLLLQKVKELKIEELKELNIFYATLINIIGQGMFL